MNIDRIEKEVVIEAPVSRVWRALTDEEEFGRWFGVELDQPFVQGQTVTVTVGPVLLADFVADGPAMVAVVGGRHLTLQPGRPK